MIKLIAGTLAAFVLGLGGVAAAQTFTSDGPSESPTVSTTTNDDTVGTTTLGTTTDEAEDIPGPCDEAEHANDPRCTGDGVATVDDRRGRGDDDHRRGRNRGPGGDDHDEDRSGSNSGRG